MNLITLKLLSLIMIIVLSAISSANADSTSKLLTAGELLKAMKAEFAVDYVGKRIVIRWHPFGNIASEERVIHQAPSTHIIELLTPVDRMAPERRLDKEDKSGNRRMGKRGERNRMRRMLPPPPRGMRHLQKIWSEDTQLLLRNYTVDVAEGESIAGQNTYLLTINPKVTSRPRKKVWLDTQHYIILRMEDYDIAGKLNSLSVYTTIDYDSASVAQKLKQYRKENQSEKEQGHGPDRPRPYQSEEISFAEAEEKFGAQLPQPSYLPAGFQLQGISVMTFRGQRIHFRYTDGLTALSLFISKVSDEREDQQRRSMRGDGFRDRRARGGRFGGGKPTNVTVKNTPISITDRGHIRILQWEVSKQSKKRNLRLALIGELSQEELVKVVESLVPKG